MSLYYFQTLTEFSREIPFKTPKCSTFFARFARDGFYYFSKRCGEIRDGFYLGGIINSPVMISIILIVYEALSHQIRTYDYLFFGKNLSEIFLVVKL